MTTSEIALVALSVVLLTLLCITLIKYSSLQEESERKIGDAWHDIRIAQIDLEYRWDALKKAEAQFMKKDTDASNEKEAISSILSSMIKREE